MESQTELTDPNALLFVNDYALKDNHDVESSPETYLDSVHELLDTGAPVGGIGIQAHPINPVAWHVYNVFQTLSKAGLPIWLTQLVVESEDEGLHADHLEMMLRVAFAHPAVEGVVLKSVCTWEDRGGIGGRNAQLVTGDWSPTESGKRLEEIVKEWSSGRVLGTIPGRGSFSSRGFLGRYRVAVEVDGMYKEEDFVLERGEGPKVVDIVIGSAKVQDFAAVLERSVAQDFFGIKK